MKFQQVCQQKKPLKAFDDKKRISHMENQNAGDELRMVDTEITEIKEKSLKCMIRPIGVSSYKLAEKNELPKELESIKELERLM